MNVLWESNPTYQEFIGSKQYVANDQYVIINAN
jgi:hypothetical protein